VLLHLVDGTAEDVAEDFRIIDRELELYSDIVSEKPRIVGLNKADALMEDELAEKTAALEEASGGRVYVLSAATGQGVQQVLRALWTEIAAQRAEAEADEEQAPWQP
jgi:GTP-binding protein